MYAYPLLNIDRVLIRVASTIFISSVDLKHAYWLIELKEGRPAITAFTVSGRPLYQFVVIMLSNRYCAFKEKEN